jgi:hypothetical protein
MGLRGCSEKDAFDDLVSAVDETGIGLGGIAGARRYGDATSIRAFIGSDEAVCGQLKDWR